MRKIVNILVILFMFFTCFARIGICGKIESEKDRIEKQKQERIEKEKGVIGNTYSIKLNEYNKSLSFCLNMECDSGKEMNVEKNLDFTVSDLVEYYIGKFFVNKLYKVILDPDGEKVTAYIDMEDFDYLYNESGISKLIFLKSEISNEERQKLISDNELKRSLLKRGKNKEQKRKSMQQVKELQI
ncbi:MAG: hypothetical protein JW976_12890 [Syntrophaceae bacterium]|nr:hypothetical protein [Syntrophaceae bacterium]